MDGSGRSAGISQLIAAHLPETLSERQRSALLEFYAGRISAGELSRRLGLTCGGAHEADRVPVTLPSPPMLAPLEPRRRRRLPWPRAALRPASHA